MITSTFNTKLSDIQYSNSNTSSYKEKLEMASIMARAFFSQKKLPTNINIMEYIKPGLQNYVKLQSEIYNNLSGVSVSRDFKPATADNLANADFKLYVNNGKFELDSFTVDLSSNPKIKANIDEFASVNQDNTIQIENHIFMAMMLGVPKVKDISNSSSLNKIEGVNSTSDFQSNVVFKSLKADCEMICLKKQESIDAANIEKVDYATLGNFSKEFSEIFSSVLKDKMMFFSSLLFNVISLRSLDSKTNRILTGDSVKSKFFVSYNLIEANNELSSIVGNEIYCSNLKTAKA